MNENARYWSHRIRRGLFMAAAFCLIRFSVQHWTLISWDIRTLWPSILTYATLAAYAEMMKLDSIREDEEDAARAIREATK